MSVPDITSLQITQAERQDMLPHVEKCAIPVVLPDPNLRPGAGG